MSAIMIDNFNREIPFCKVYSLDGKEKLEKIFLKNRISYFIEWQNKSFFQKVFGSKDKTVFTIRINEADAERARELVQGIDSVKIRQTEQDG